MRKTTILSMILLLAAVSILHAETRYKWITIGSLQNFYYDTGSEWETIVYGRQQWGFTWDSFYRDQDMQAAKGMWIGVKNFNDPVLGKVIPYKIAHNGPRPVVNIDSCEYIPQEIKLIARYNHPEVYVNDKVASDMVNGIYAKNDDIDEVDPLLPVDRLVYNTVNTSVGLSFTRKVYAVSQQNYDNIHIIEYEFENTGIYDRSGHTFTQTLDSVYFHWQWRDAISQEGCWNGSFSTELRNWILTNVRDVRWGYSMMFDVIGEDQDNPTLTSVHEDMTGLDAQDDNGVWMRGYMSWMGKWSDFGYDNIGSPNVNSVVHDDLPPIDDGRLGSAQYKGAVVVHADRSTADHSDDPLQPKSNSYINSNNFNTFTSSLNQYDEVAMANKYQQYMANGNMGSQAEQVWNTAGGDAGVYSQMTVAAGYSQMLAFGPYTIAPGEKIKIVFAECADGLGHDYAYQIGQQWYKAKYNGETVTVVDPDNPTATKTINSATANAWKDAMVYSGRDSLMNTFRKAINLYNNGFYNTIPAAPKPPEKVEIFSTANGIKITWKADQSLSSPSFEGFKLYRSTSAKDSVYQEIFDCNITSGTLNDNLIEGSSNEYEFLDTLTFPEVDCFYYVIAYDDGSHNLLNPGIPLISNPLYTRSNISVSTYYSEIISPEQGDGSEESPYHIRSINNLYWITMNPDEWNKNYIQTSNIDASETWDWLGNEGWTPIPLFTGSYNGQGYIIDSLFINKGDADNIGLFGKTEGAVLQNIGLTNLNITGKNNVGGVVGYEGSSSIINKCFTTGQITGISNIGGLVGANITSKINDSYSGCVTTGESNTGGLTGNNSGIITSSYSYGSVTGTSGIGGLVGVNSNMVINCFWDEQSSGQLLSAGGVGKTSSEMKSLITYSDAGWNLINTWTIKEDINNAYPYLSCFNLSPIQIREVTDITNNSAIIQYIADSGLATRGICWNTTGNPTLSDNKVDGGNLDSNGVYNVQMSVLEQNTHYYVRAFATESSTTIFSNLILFKTIIFSETGTIENPYKISSIAHLQWISDNPMSWDKHFIQTSDIDMAATSSWSDGMGWKPLGFWYDGLFNQAFTGSFDGQDYSISNLYINRGAQDNIGLFSYTQGAEISNINLVNIDITANENVGSLIGKNTSSIINNCHTDGCVKGEDYTGGLIGYNDLSKIDSCSCEGTVDGHDFTGGLIAINKESDIQDCYNNSSVSGNYRVGGLIAYQNDSRVNDSYNTGTISARLYAGGLVGETRYSDIINCYSAGPVSASRSLGGLIANNYSTNVDASFWDTQISGQMTSDGGSGKTTSEMKMESTYTDSGWNFVDMWVMDGMYNDGYPSLKWQVFGVGVDETIIPSTSILKQNYPNPFNPITTINYTLNRAANVKLLVYDVSGKLVRTLINSHQSSGSRSIIWDGKNDKGNIVGSGMYFYRLTAGDPETSSGQVFIETKKMIFMK